MKTSIIYANMVGNKSETKIENNLFKSLALCLWVLFFGCCTLLIFIYNGYQTFNNGLFRINGFTALMWCLITFFGAIISTYSKTYLTGFKFYLRYTLLMLGFIFCVMLFVASEHIVFILSSWFLMGVCIAQLIGADKDWAEAVAASKLAQKWFALSSLFLTIGILILAFSSKLFTITGIMEATNDIDPNLVLLSAVFIILAALIQSAIYPFHRWLLSSMTAPTPASALMHAGFVNGSGILLTLFSTILFTSGTLHILLVIGGFTAIAAQFTKLIQTSVKQKLACSTIAQMGFMLMQCGLGFFSAAVVHLILHGFYKAYLFLSAGENIEATMPKENLGIQIKPLQIIAVFINGILGAYLFSTLTGKGMAADSGIFLTLIVAITVGQFTYNVVKEKSISIWQKIIFPPAIFLVGIVCYALVYNAVSELMKDMPLVDMPTSLSFLQVLIGVIFLIGFFMMKLGLYRKLPWLYVKLLNDSQPNNNTILMFKNKS